MTPFFAVATVPTHCTVVNADSCCLHNVIYAIAQIRWPLATLHEQGRYLDIQCCTS